MEYSKIDPDFKQKWVKALRSGRYRQGDGALRLSGGDGKGYRYCCLGVACNIESSRKWKAEGAGLFAWNGFEAKKDDHFLEFGLGDEVTAHLIQMNDGGIPFNEIADWIETNL